MFQEVIESTGEDHATANQGEDVLSNDSPIRDVPGTEQLIPKDSPII